MKYTLEINNNWAIIALWVIIGIWICWKRQWYINQVEDDDRSFANFICILNIAFMPLAVFISFLNEYVIRKWNNK